MSLCRVFAEPASPAFPIAHATHGARRASTKRSEHHPCFTYVDRVVVRAYVKQAGPQKIEGNNGVPGPHFLPAALESNLSELPAGYVRIAVRGHLVLFEAESRQVVDRLPHALQPV